MNIIFSLFYLKYYVHVILYCDFFIYWDVFGNNVYIFYVSLTTHFNAEKTETQKHQKHTKTYLCNINVSLYMFVCICTHTDTHTYIYTYMYMYIYTPSILLEMGVCSLGQNNSLEKEIATHSNVLAWKIFHGQRELVGYSPWNYKETDMA